MTQQEKQPERKLTEEEKRDIQRHARMFLRACGVDVPVGDRKPLKIEIVDDDGTVIETVYK